MANKRLIAQRKRICFDVQEQLKLQRIFAIQGDYLDLPKTNDEEEEIYDAYYRQYTNAIDKYATAYVTPKKCNVCAIGSLFVTSVDRYNKIMVSDTALALDGKEMLPHLSRWWNDEELRLMEVAFEGSIVDMPESLLDPQTDKEYADKKAWMKLVDRARSWRTKIHDRYYNLASTTHDKWNGTANYTLHFICQKIINHPEGIFRG